MSGSGRAWAQRMRKAAREHLAALLVRQRHRCHWCGVPLIDYRTIPAGQIVSRDNFEVVWKPRHGGVKRRATATVDHLIELKNIGPGLPFVRGFNDIDNLVAACQRCNGARSALPGNWRACVRCGVQIKGREYCHRCNYVVWIELSGALPGEVGEGDGLSRRSARALRASDPRGELRQR